MNKASIINRVKNASPEELGSMVQELVSYIKEGVVSLDELQGTNNLPRTIQRTIKDIIENSEKTDWEEACRNGKIEYFQRYLDTHTTGQFRDEARQKMREIEENALFEDETRAWNSACENKSIEAFEHFASQYPNGKYIEKAKQRINDIYNAGLYNDSVELLKSEINTIYSNLNIIDENVELLQVIKNHNSKEDVLSLIKNDNNIFSAEIVKTLIKENVITGHDLDKTGINNLFVKSVLKYEKPKKNEEDKEGDYGSIRPNSIKEGTTEIYFWGVPNSGKTCALGAILSSMPSVAEAMELDKESKAYGYMSTLAQIFSMNAKDICILPSGTYVGAIHEMKFTLTDSKNEERPVACLDLSGEIFTAMFHSHAGDTLNQEQEDTLSDLNQLLRASKNRKVHFFVIEYGAEDKLYRGNTHKLYLDAAAQYIKSNDVFDKSTDGIYLLITKTDKIPSRENKEAHLKEYIAANYERFYKNIKNICKNYSINNGEAGLIAFTMGQVCFQNFCRFDATSAKNVSNIIMQSAVPKKKPSKLRRLLSQ